MTVVVFNVPVSYTAEDNLSYINKTSVLIKDCSQLGNPNPECNGYNFNRCPNDSSYCQPFVKGDVISLQFAINVKKYKKIFVAFVNSATGQEQTVVYTTESGTDSLLTHFLNVIVDTNQSIFDTMTCWFVKIKMYGCLLEQGNTAQAYFTCVDHKQSFDGMTAAEAAASCYEEQCNIADFIASEPYCAVRCDEQTLLITGLYTKYDCDGHYYGAFTSGSATNSFMASHRVRGIVEPNGFTFDKTVVNNKYVKSAQKETFILFCKPVPYYVAQQIAICFNSKDLQIDGVSYTGGLTLNKNFDEGSEWIIKENIYLNCDEINFTCD